MSKGFSLGNIMKQAQELQDRLGKVQEEAANRIVEASSGGGMVTARVTGRIELVGLRIDPEVLKTSDAEMLQDLILAAVNQAIRDAQAMMAEEMKKITGGLGIPGLGG